MSADIDIDFADRDQALKLIRHTAARQTVDGRVRRHNSAVYVTDIPWDPVYQCAAIDYQRAQERGYFKIDFLNMHVYSLVRNREHYQQLLNQEPDWSALCNNPLNQQLVHVGNYTSLLKDMQPDSVIRLAALLSVIRPGKAHLQRQPWHTVLCQVWDGDSSRGFVFKRSHAVAYAHLVVLHWNILTDLAHQHK